MPKKELPTLKPEAEQVAEQKQETFKIPKYKTVTLISINPVEPSMWKYAEQETARFYEILKNEPNAAFTHIFTNLKVEVKTIQIEV
jgi:hypothetical protein